MRFGYYNASFEYDSDNKTDAAVSLARRLERAGFDTFTLMDHLQQIPFIGAPEEPFFDCYTLLPAVAQATDEIELSALVTSPGYRNPAYLGRVLTTLDHVSDGRAALGIGAGWYEAEYDAYGYEFPDAPTRIAQMRETIELVRAMWTEESPVSYEGEHYAIEDLVLEPKPVQGELPVLIGGGGEELTLRAVAEHADRWNLPGGSPEGFAHKQEVLAEHCADFGRSPEAIEGSSLMGCVIRDTTDAAHGAFERLRAKSGTGVTADRDEFRGLVGTPEDVIELVSRFEDVGADMLVVRAERNDEETIERFCGDVLPSFS